MEFTEQDRDALYQTWMSQNRECELRRWSFQKARNEPLAWFQSVERRDNINDVFY